MLFNVFLLPKILNVFIFFANSESAELLSYSARIGAATIYCAFCFLKSSKNYRQKTLSWTQISPNFWSVMSQQKAPLILQINTELITSQCASFVPCFSNAERKKFYCTFIGIREYVKSRNLCTCTTRIYVCLQKFYFLSIHDLETFLFTLGFPASDRSFLGLALGLSHWNACKNALPKLQALKEQNRL